MGIGGIGMLQNLFATATPRDPRAARLGIIEFLRAQIIIRRRIADISDKDAKNNDLKKVNISLAAFSSWAS